MQHTEIYDDYVDVVAVLYHWGAGVCCRKVLDNFQVEAVSVEPEEKVIIKGGKEGKKKHYQLIQFVLGATKYIPPLVNCCHVS